MKTKTLKEMLLVSTLLIMPVVSNAHNDRNDKDYDYAYYIMSPKNWQSGNQGDKTLRITGKAGETKSVNFKGTVKVPSSIKVNAGILRVGTAQAFLVFDNVQCKYEAKVNKLFFNFNYTLVSCSDNARANDEMDINSKISLYLKETKGFPATAYATINVVDTYVKGITLPQLEADKGQILRFDGELWVPTDYIPDGQAAGDVLVWDGAGWTASKITGGSGTPGAQGEKGEKGDKGDKGDTGAQGLQGPAGATGATGAVGPKGATGDKGATGATGATGPQGLQGPQGLAGPAGATGPQGPAGPAGAAGAKGEKGDKGDKGETGAQGLQGPQGLAGANGATGAVGPQGPAGVKGDKGDKGDTGEAGAVGPQGPAGAAGVAGAKGEKGDKGEKGEAGNPGLVSLVAGNGIVGETISGNGGTIAVNTGTAAGQIPVIGSNGRLPSSIIPQSKTVFLKDVKPSGTHGGSCDPTKGWEQIRDLNTINGDSSFVSLSQNQFTLAAGTYEFDINAPAYLDGFHKAILVNAATGEFVLIGSNTRSHNVSGGMDPSRIVGIVTITEATTFVIKHRCATAMNTFGFGVAASFGVDEVYTQVKIVKEK